MFKSTVAQFSDQINEFLENAVWKPGQELDFSKIETELRNLLKKIGETLLQLILADVIESRDFLSILKMCGVWKSYRPKEYRQITITLDDGQKIEVNSPFFLKTTAKRGHKKRGPNNRGCHLGLELLGIYEKMSPLFASKKWLNYFDKNRTRMQYQNFKEKSLPCGSGCVESAIRRVINLRLKSAGSFWLKQVAEYMLFLRSVLLSGRWKIFMTKFFRRESQAFEKFSNRPIARPS